MITHHRIYLLIHGRLVAKHAVVERHSTRCAGSAPKEPSVDDELLVVASLDSTQASDTLPTGCPLLELSFFFF